MMLKVLFSILFLIELGFAQKNFSDEMKESFDTQVLQELVEQAPVGDCRNPKYIEQVKFFLASSVDYQRFAPNSIGAFLVHRIESIGGKPAPINLNACFVEAMFFAILPDVVKADKELRADRKFLIKLWAEFTHQRETDNLKEAREVKVAGVMKQAYFANNLLSLSQIRSCNFAQDPFMYLAATAQLQAFIDNMFSGMGSLSYPGGDPCVRQLYNSDPKNYLNNVNSKLHELWGQ